MVCTKKHLESAKKYRDRPENKKKQQEYMLARRLADVEKAREYSRHRSFKHNLKKHGLTIEQYDILWKTQNCCCLICKTDKVNTNRGWHLDHCHTTGKIRGILCVNCNVMLGLARDRIDVLESAIIYLSKE